MDRQTLHPSTPADNRGLALVGFMGAGKSTVGRILADRLGWPFLDTDGLLERSFGPIPDQLRQIGEAAFRAREAAAIEALCDGVLRVLATGGGAFDDARSRAWLAGSYTTVFLAAPLAVLARRVGGADRPLWNADVSERFSARQAAYAEAMLYVDTSGRTPDEVADVILAAVTP